MTEGKKTIQMIIMVIGLTITAKFSGFFRDVLIGSNFGTSSEADAYFMALKITAMVFMSMGSAITTTMIPIIVRYLTKDDRDKAFRFANKIFTILVSIGIVFMSMGILFSNYYTKWIARGFYGEKLALAVTLTRIMFPILLCCMISYIFVSMLQSFGKFSITSILSIPYNFVLIIYLSFFAGKYGIEGLAFATVIGWITQFVIQIPYLYKKGYRINFILDFKDPDIKRFFKLIFPILLSTMVYNVNIIIDSSLASTLSEGKIAALTYAFIVYTAISSTTIYGISTVLFPKFAQNTSLKDYTKFQEQITSTIKVLCFLLIPLTVGLITLRTPIIKLAFQRGAFGEQGVIFTRIALTYYAIGMIGFGIQEVLNKCFFALQDTKTPMKFGIMSVTINIILNIILIKKMDLAGLALATSLATISNALFLYGALMKKIGKLDTGKILINFFKVLTASMVMAVFTYKTYKVFTLFVGMESFSFRLITIIGSVFVGILVYAVMVLILRVEEAKYIIENYLKKLIP
ncbi:murein biosynthesis integral membrane protein MurJ [Crassaminicella thermophila]|uniref:Probable lipid II flippase MurJ n=1 Tax=Crassaminicella thermophila TaxID=2599308 RepID=A0A5C0SCJ1_CRATE|nr:murein biosynthesis integral membrane protein MurJ [Crassaminicella thermophila]QEK11446.1 murein biosynthesis integral membrane protein MurJ [Crassaminicella thermophila]